MPTFIEMPKLSDTMTEGTLLKWLKQVGDAVEIGDVIAEVETDKATMEMEAFDEGTLGKIYVGEGEQVAIGTNLAVLVGEGEEPPESPAPPAAVPPPAKGPAAEGAGAIEAAALPRPGPAGDVGTLPPASTGAEASSGRVKASPLARKVAVELGVDLAGLEGTGPGGRVVKSDVLRAAEGGGRGGETAASGAPGEPPAPGPTPAATAAAPKSDTTVPLTGMRRIIADRLLESKTQIPHFYLHTEVDAAPLMALRRQLNGAQGDGPEANNFTVNDFVLNAVVAAAREVPEVNASFAGDRIVQFASIQLAVAVAVDAGLVTPVIRAAETKSLAEISAEVKDLASRARGKRLAPDEMQGGTLTVSNLGAYGIDRFDAIINPPQAAIIAVGAIVKKPVIDEASGGIVPGLRMDVGLSGDHRVVDGAIGARFLAALRSFLEQPALMLV